MFKKEITRAIDLLKENGIRLEKGMTQAQIEQAQEYHEITFPPDLKAFLMTALPISYPFYDWTDDSDGNQDRIRQRLEWPIEGILCDVERNALWLNEFWGEKSDKFPDDLKTAENFVRTAPKLIPIYGHRYIPGTPNESLNPVFSVYGTDIIYYGENIWDYFEYEFTNKEYKTMNFKSIKHIPFWSHFAA